MLIFKDKISRLKGFTMIEVLVVILVVGVLVSIVLPHMYKAKEKSKQAEAIEILLRMYKGYKSAIIDGILIPELDNYKLYYYLSFSPPGLRYRCFNPDESDLSPNSPNQRSVLSWQAIGFSQNPNYDTNSYYFSYDFLKPFSAGWLPQDYNSGGTGRPNPGYRPSAAGVNQAIGVAWLKSSSTPVNDLYPIYPESQGKWIFIDMDTGNITKGSHFK